jgi:ribosomal protein S18 acetylase RimI-like enzyme
MSKIIWNKQDLIYNQKYRIDIRQAHKENDFNSILKINRQSFIHDNENEDYARKWIEDHQHQHYYVITLDDTIVVGYALWSIKGGYKQRLTCELEQIAIDNKYLRQGFAFYLIQISLIKFQYLQQKLLKINCKITCVYLSTGCDNLSAQNLYRKALHVEQKGGLVGALYGENEYGTEEIIMANTNIEMIVDKLCEEYLIFLV